MGSGTPHRQEISAFLPLWLSVTLALAFSLLLVLCLDTLFLPSSFLLRPTGTPLPPLITFPDDGVFRSWKNAGIDTVVHVCM